MAPPDLETVLRRAQDRFRPTGTPPVDRRTVTQRLRAWMDRHDEAFYTWIEVLGLAFMGLTVLSFAVFVVALLVVGLLKP